MFSASGLKTFISFFKFENLQQNVLFGQLLPFLFGPLDMECLIKLTNAQALTQYAAAQFMLSLIKDFVFKIVIDWTAVPNYTTVKEDATLQFLSFRLCRNKTT